MEEYKYADNQSFCFFNGLVDRQEMFFFEIAYYMQNNTPSSSVSFGLALPNEFVKNQETVGFVKSPYQIESHLSYNRNDSKLERSLNIKWSGESIVKGIIINDFNVISALKVHHEAIRKCNISPCFVKFKCSKSEYTTTNFLVKNLLIVSHGLCISTNEKNQSITFNGEEQIKVNFSNEQLIDYLDYGTYYKGGYVKDDNGFFTWNGEGNIYRKKETGEYIEIEGTWKIGKINLESCQIWDSTGRSYSLMYYWDGKELRNTPASDHDSVAVWGPIDLGSNHLSVFLTQETQSLYLDCYFLNMKRLTIGLDDASVVFLLKEIKIGNYCLAKTEHFGIYDLPSLRFLSFGYHSLNDCLDFVLFGTALFP